VEEAGRLWRDELEKLDGRPAELVHHIVLPAEAVEESCMDGDGADDDEGHGLERELRDGDPRGNVAEEEGSDRQEAAEHRLHRGEAFHENSPPPDLVFLGGPLWHLVLEVNFERLEKGGETVRGFPGVEAGDVGVDRGAEDGDKHLLLDREGGRVDEDLQDGKHPGGELREEDHDHLVGQRAEPRDGRRGRTGGADGLLSLHEQLDRVSLLDLVQLLRVDGSVDAVKHSTDAFLVCPKPAGPLRGGLLFGSGCQPSFLLLLLLLLLFENHRVEGTE